MHWFWKSASCHHLRYMLQRGWIKYCTNSFGLCYIYTHGSVLDLKHHINKEPVEEACYNQSVIFSFQFSGFSSVKIEWIPERMDWLELLCGWSSSIFLLSLWILRCYLYLMEYWVILCDCLSNFRCKRRSNASSLLTWRCPIRPLLNTQRMHKFELNLVHITVYVRK